MLRFRSGIVAVVLGVFASVTSADDSKLKVKVGDQFPTDAVAATKIDDIKKGAKTVSIRDLKGKTVVIAFYPKALTGG
jgi:thioredoxin-dependent peroxiredoxin